MKRVLPFLLVLVVLLGCVVDAGSYWIEKRVALWRYYNVPREHVTKDYIRLYTEYRYTGISNNGTYYLYPTNVTGIIARTIGLPAIYLDFEIKYGDEYESVYPLISLYHLSEKYKEVLEARIWYLRNITDWVVLINLVTYKINISSYEKTVVDSVSINFTQKSDRIELYMYPQFYTKLESGNAYLIFGFKGRFKNSGEIHDFEIAYDKVILADNETKYNEAVKERIGSIGNWYVWIGIGIWQYEPERSRIMRIAVNDKNIVQKQEVYIYGLSIEDWRFDPELVYQEFVEGGLPVYSGAKIENLYLQPQTTYPLLLPPIIALFIAGALRAGAKLDKNVVVLIFFIAWLILGAFFGYGFTALFSVVLGLAGAILSERV